MNKNIISIKQRNGKTAEKAGHNVVKPMNRKWNEKEIWVQ